jgi:hypothetical protein
MAPQNRYVLPRTSEVPRESRGLQRMPQNPARQPKDCTSSPAATLAAASSKSQKPCERAKRKRVRCQQKLRQSCGVSFAETSFRSRGSSHETIWRFACTGPQEKIIAKRIEAEPGQPRRRSLRNRYKYDYNAFAFFAPCISKVSCFAPRKQRNPSARNPPTAWKNPVRPVGPAGIARGEWVRHAFTPPGVWSEEQASLHKVAICKSTGGQSNAISALKEKER